MNLLKETVLILKEHNLSLSDVKWWGSVNAYFPLEDLEGLLDLDYDDGFGGTRIPSDLIIVGDGWWLERWEYDGSEGWSFKGSKTKPEKAIRPRSIVCENTLFISVRDLNLKEAFNGR